MAELSGRSALITGAGQNVGAETARRLATSGAYVGVNDIVAERAEAVVEEIRGAGGKADTVVADVTDLAAVTEAFGRFGPVDILVNNAGIPLSGFGMKVFWQEDPSAWKPFIDLNVYGPMNCTYAVLGGMVERGWGRVITIGSESARGGDRKLAAYAASKGAGPALMRSLAKEVGNKGVTCNTLSLATQARDGMDNDDGLRLKALSSYVVPRFGRSADVAAAVVWLASDDAAWVTGQTIPINGGYITT
ncbi:SDR family oxidoreductase [Acidiferrimicrobium sp. IK]|uniref:SDR family NAD(P)-dependent oxidoreductase n=1 Tax=Acidiferrimicrobium sp. IK TaxID=2871700 RepID=UPI0021CAF6E6|nr:SDR family NAD(P)-dependent oxidoreductase [Acidiferrimicrobium sp. IK]MCU4186806.1 SDR family oxidoreductase [Acidiferrimicrobium sp. IK]